jgi:hypothetical protein
MRGAVRAADPAGSDFTTSCQCCAIPYRRRLECFTCDPSPQRRSKAEGAERGRQSVAVGEDGRCA